MADKSKSKKLLDDLHQAVERGDILPELLGIARRGVRIGGNVNDSVVIDGNDNIVVITKAEPVPHKTVGFDEQSLFAESIKEYHQEQTGRLAKVSTRPYPGLLPYKLQDAHQFFGRDQSIAELLTKIQLNRITWLHGRSGTGKSSIIEAGLMPALLNQGDYPILVRPFSELPTTALKKKLLGVRLQKNSNVAEESLQQFLARVSQCLHEQQIFIFFDQFEEFFTKIQDEPKREVFAEELADCAADFSLPVHFVFSLLTDKFGETLLLRERLPAGTGVESFLRPLNHKEAVNVITSPFKQLGISFEDGLVETILQHLEYAEIASPQLQLVCQKLFQSMPENSRQITFEQYQKLGETKGIIKDYLKRALHDEQIVPAYQQKAAAYLLSTLVTPEGERDAKTLSEWCIDERVQPWTLDWHKKQNNFSLADSASNLQALRHIAVINYIRKIEPYVTIKGDDLRQIIREMEEPIFEDYLHQLQKEFVNKVVESLRNARLIHEVQTEDGDLAYELVHDYLIAEVKDWLDADERAVRQLRRKLDQKHLDLSQHKLLLEPKELEIVAAQLENPRFALLEKDKRLILLSAAAYGNGQKWLALCGSQGLDWLREIYRDEQYPQLLRQGIVTCLGEAGDEPTYTYLLERIRHEPESSKQTFWLDLLSHYLNHSPKNAHLPWPVNLMVFLRLSHLRFMESAMERSRMSRIAVSLAAICCVIFLGFNPFKDVDPSVRFGIAVVFLILSVIFSFLFTQSMTLLQWIARRWSWIWQFLSFALTGSAIGSLLFLFMAGGMEIGFAGGIIGLALIYSVMKRRPWDIVLISLITVLIFALTFLVLGGENCMGRLGSALSASAFSGLYIYFSKYTKPT